MTNPPSDKNHQELMLVGLFTLAPWAGLAIYALLRG
jgi:hypothetical protein